MNVIYELMYTIGMYITIFGAILFIYECLANAYKLFRRKAEEKEAEENIEMMFGIIKGHRDVIHKSRLKIEGNHFLINLDEVEQIEIEQEIKDALKK